MHFVRQPVPCLRPPDAQQAGQLAGTAIVQCGQGLAALSFRTEDQLLVPFQSQRPRPLQRCAELGNFGVDLLIRQRFFRGSDHGAERPLEMPLGRHQGVRCLFRRTKSKPLDQRLISGRRAAGQRGNDHPALEKIPAGRQAGFRALTLHAAERFAEYLPGPLQFEDIRHGRTLRLDLESRFAAAVGLVPCDNVVFQRPQQERAEASSGGICLGKQITLQNLADHESLQKVFDPRRARSAGDTAGGRAGQAGRAARDCRSPRAAGPHRRHGPRRSATSAWTERHPRRHVLFCPLQFDSTRGFV